MDVEKLRRVNQLSAELRKHNMAATSDDAFSQAEQIVRQDDVREFLQRAKESEKDVNNPSSDQLYQIKLERDNRQLAEHIQKLYQEVGHLKAEMEQLKKAPPIQQPAEKPKVEQQAVLKTEKKEPHPRQGDFKPDDVSVEKMFYFGNK